jgi:hypothetical protein
MSVNRAFITRWSCPAREFLCENALLPPHGACRRVRSRSQSSRDRGAVYGACTDYAQAYWATREVGDAWNGQGSTETGMTLGEGGRATYCVPGAIMVVGADASVREIKFVGHGSGERRDVVPAASR